MTSSKKKIILLLTCVGGDLSPELIIQIKKSKIYDYTIVGVDENDNAVGKFFCDKFYRVPSGSEKIKFVNCIVSIIEKESVDFVIPSADEEAIAVSQYRRKIEKKGCKVITDDYKIIQILNNKLRTYKYLEEKKINKFFWKSIRDYNEMISFLKNQKFLKEFVLKTSNDRGSRNIFYIKNFRFYDFKKDEISKIEFKKKLISLKKFSPFLIMENLIPPVYDIDVLTWKGKLLKIVQRKRLNSDDPNMGHKLVHDEKIFNFCKNIVETLKLTWLYDCDLMFNKKGYPCLLEINPRKSGSLIISLLAKVSLVDDVISLALKKKPSQGSGYKEQVFIPYKTMLKIKKC